MTFLEPREFCFALGVPEGWPFEVGRGLVPHQPCFGVLTVGARESIRSPRLCPPEAGKAEGNLVGTLNCVVRQNASVGASPERMG